MKATTLLVAVVSLAVVGGGCGSGTKAGGQHVHMIVLTIATPTDSDPGVAEYAAAVDRLSGGSIRIVPQYNWRTGAADPGAATLADVRRRRVALGEVAVRTYARLGSHAFDVLSAPFLVDSLALEERFLENPIARELLATVRRRGVEGVAMLPGPIERPFGLERRLLGPATYRGAVIGTTSMQVAAPVLRSLRATARSFRGTDLPPWRFTGAVLDLSHTPPPVFGQSSVTTNVGFWPTVSTVVGNRAVLQRLGPARRGVLERAARVVLAPVTAELAEEDRAAVGVLCRHDRIAVVRATPVQVSSLRRSVRPLYAGFERDGLARTVLDAVDRLKRTTRPAAALACGPRIAPESTASVLDGDWRMTAAGSLGESIDNGKYRLVLRHGRVGLSFSKPGTSGWSAHGVFRVEGPRLLFRFDDGTSAVYRWNMYRGALILQLPPGLAEAPNPTFAPWRRVGD